MDSVHYLERIVFGKTLRIQAQSKLERIGGTELERIGGVTYTEYPKYHFYKGWLQNLPT